MVDRQRLVKSLKFGMGVGGITSTLGTVVLAELYAFSKIEMDPAEILALTCAYLLFSTMLCTFAKYQWDKHAASDVENYEQSLNNEDVPYEYEYSRSYSSNNSWNG